MEKSKLPKTLQPFADKIADLDLDPDGWSVGLVRGWYCPETETHAIYETTLSQIVGKLRGVVRCGPETCDMKDCGPKDMREVITWTSPTPDSLPGDLQEVMFVVTRHPDGRPCNPRVFCGVFHDPGGCFVETTAAVLWSLETVAWWAAMPHGPEV
jgi:hypothetical protein